MKTAHLIKLTVFSHPDEDIEEVQKRFLSFFPFNPEERKISLKKKNAVGFEDKKITILEISLEKQRHINEFLNNLTKNLDENQKNKILQQSESRLDQNLDFFLRFDKDELVKNNKLSLTDSGNCFHIKISIAAFPKKREIASNIIKKIFTN